MFMSLLMIISNIIIWVLAITKKIVWDFPIWLIKNTILKMIRW